MTELPLGWAQATVEELAAVGGITDGPFGSNLKTEHYTDSGPRVVRLQNIGDGHFRDEEAHISEDHFAQLQKHRVLGGDVLIASLGEVLPRACIAPSWLGPAIVKADCIRVRPGEHVLPAYLLWALNSPQTREHVGESIKGVGRPRINLGELRSLELPVAPLPEQERIVTAVEEAFSRLDAGEAGVRVVRQLLKRLRDAILGAASTGRLISQDPADTPASNLLADIGAEPTDPPVGGPTLPRTWAWCALGSLARDAGYGTSIKCGYEETGIGVLRIPNIQGGALDLDDLKRAPSGASIDAELLLMPGDLLIVRTNGSRDLIGRCAPVTSEVGCSFASYLIRFRTLPNAIDARFLSILLTAPWWRRELEAAAASSAGQYNLSLRSLSPFPIALPPREEQARIVAEVERQMSFIEACQRAVDAGLARSAALRRSVLKTAFEGRLVPQDPTDEPASVLLERIRAERAAAPKATSRRAGAKA